MSRAGAARRAHRAPTASTRSRVRDGPYSITAKHDDYAQGEVELLVAGKPLSVDFKLTPAARRSAASSIARDTDKPVPDAMIMASRLGQPAHGRAVATSGDDGTFTLRGRRARRHAITAKAPGYATTSPTRSCGSASARRPTACACSSITRSRSAAASSPRATTKAIGRRVVGAFTGARRCRRCRRTRPARTARSRSSASNPARYIMFAIGEETVPGLGKTVQIVDKDVTGVEIELDRGITMSGSVDPPAKRPSRSRRRRCRPRKHHGRREGRDRPRRRRRDRRVEARARAGGKFTMTARTARARPASCRSP